jgi:hypothetical protein
VQNDTDWKTDLSRSFVQMAPEITGTSKHKLPNWLASFLAIDAFLSKILLQQSSTSGPYAYV